MLKVHHLNQSRSKRVLWLLEELGMEYQRIDHQRDEQTRLAPQSLKAVHPLAKAPVIEDGEIKIAESSTIMEYVLDKAGDTRLRPEAGSAEYYAYLEWSHFAEGTLSLPVIANLLMSMEDRVGGQAMDGYIAKELELNLGYVEATLENRAYFAGAAFTAADIMMTVMLEFAHSMGLLEHRPHTQAYLAKIEQRPAYKIAAKCG